MHFPSSSETVDIVTSESESEIVTQVSAVNSGSVKVSIRIIFYRKTQIGIEDHVVRSILVVEYFVFQQACLRMFYEMRQILEALRTAFDLGLHSFIDRE